MVIICVDAHRAASEAWEGRVVDKPLRIAQHDGIVRLQGELDSTGTAELAAMFRRIDGHLVVVDLSELSFMDSSGVHALYEAKAAHPQVRFVNPTPPVRRVFELTGTDAFILDG